MGQYLKQHSCGLPVTATVTTHDGSQKLEIDRNHDHCGAQEHIACSLEKSFLMQLTILCAGSHDAHTIVAW